MRRLFVRRQRVARTLQRRVGCWGACLGDGRCCLEPSGCFDTNTVEVEANRASSNLPSAACARCVPSRTVLDKARAIVESARANMIALQEELDWHCYELYQPDRHNTTVCRPPALLFLGERPFEIIMARQAAAGNLDTEWFMRPRSVPREHVPMHWPADYRAVVERRIALIETDPTIGLIERPEYKRRWSDRTMGNDGARRAARLAARPAGRRALLAAEPTAVDLHPRPCRCRPRRCGFCLRRRALCR